MSLPSLSLALSFLAPPDALVLAREPCLGDVAPLVRAVCAQPWEIRHPRDLALACDTTLSTLKRQLKPIGFTRVEHFITYVRHVLLEQLAAQRIPLATARRLAGIRDSSNLRRQLRRATRGSPLPLQHGGPRGGERRSLA